MDIYSTEVGYNPPGLGKIKATKQMRCNEPLLEQAWFLAGFEANVMCLCFLVVTGVAVTALPAKPSAQL